MINPLANLYHQDEGKTYTSTPKMFMPQNNVANIRANSEQANQAFSLFGVGNGAAQGAGAGAGGVGAGAGGAGVAPVTSTDTAISGNDLYAKYRDPKTGEIMSPEEYAIYLGNKAPRGNGQIPNYAGDAMTNPNQTSNELIGRATNLNNARNDIATGTADPYGVGNKSGIAYSPSELKAIEKAYAGVYDPALNDVFSRLRDKQAAEEKLADMEAKVFSTNEAIRQWRATTGTKKSGGSGSGGDFDFSNADIKKGVANSGLGFDAFNAIESDDIKNYWITPPNVSDPISGKTMSLPDMFLLDIKAIEDGEKTLQEVMDTIVSTRIPQDVQTYLIDQLPAEPEEKEGAFSKIWGWAVDKIMN